jgi:hypothetical protein
MPLKPLPSSPSLDHFKHQAQDLRKAIRARDPQAAQRIREFHPRLAGAEDETIFAAAFALSDAQLTIAREYGLKSWAKLRELVNHGVVTSRPRHEQITDPLFRNAVDLLDAGDSDALSHLLAANPEIVRQRADFPVSDYFGRPTLLEFVAENPIRHGTLPPNIVELARIILEAGAKDDLGPSNRALGLVASGAVARRSGMQSALIDLLCDYGADPASAVQSAVGQGEFAAAEALIARGAPIDLAVAAATGRTDVCRTLLPTANSEERHRALAWASQYGHLDIVIMLLDAGEDPSRYNPPGAHAHSTPLHQAAFDGHIDVVRLLVEHGADPKIKDVLYQGTPVEWAEHGGQTAVADYLRNR